MSVTCRYPRTAGGRRTGALLHPSLPYPSSQTVRHRTAATDKGHRHEHRETHTAPPTRKPAARDRTLRLLAAGHHEDHESPLPMPGCAGQRDARGFGHMRPDTRITACNRQPCGDRRSWSLDGCSYVAAHPDTRRYNMASGPAEPRTKQYRALNPRVQGSSPWRRTRVDLGILDVIENAQRPFCGDFRAVGARWVLRCRDLVDPAPRWCLHRTVIGCPKRSASGTEI
jgi:hypothetical protein